MKNMHIIKIEIESGKAMIEVALPECSDREQDKFWSIWLWDEKDLPAFHCSRTFDEEEPCMIRLLHPKLWEGQKAPRLYRLELYAEDLNSQMQLLERRFLALYSLKEIAPKGWFLNGQEFEVKGVYYDRPKELFDADRQGFETGFNFRLDQLVKMGANMFVLGATDGLTGPECVWMQECCHRKGMIWQITDKNDNCVTGSALFGKSGLPTKEYYRYKARWSKEPFVYICKESFIKQPDGSHSITVYSNRKKIALLINGTVFAFQEDGPEFCFQDIQIKGFPVCLTVEADECSMSVVCYGVKRDSNIC